MKIIIVGPSGSGKTSFYLPDLIKKLNKNNFLISTIYDERVKDQELNVNWKSIDYKIYSGEELSDNDLLFIDELCFADFPPNLIETINTHKNVIMCFNVLDFEKELFIHRFPFIDTKDFIFLDVKKYNEFIIE